MTRMQRRVALAVTAAALALGLAPAAAVTASPAFGIEGFEVHMRERDGSPAVRAGGHPYELTAKIALNTVLTPEGEVVPVEQERDVSVDLPPGLIGDPRAASQCSAANLFEGTCPAESQIGTAAFALEGSLEVSAPVYGLKPLLGHAEEFGVAIPGDTSGNGVFIITAGLRAGTGYGLRLTDAGIQRLGLTSLTLSIWGVPADPAHDPQRGETCLGSSCSGGGQHVEAPLRPFLTNPTECSGSPLPVKASADPWVAPGAFATAESTLPPLEGCDKLSFLPRISARPTTKTVDAPAGLDLDIEVPQAAASMPLDLEGNVDYGADLAVAGLRDATVALPAGLSFNPSSTNGLAACTESQAGLHTTEGREEPAHCPDSAKVGTVEIATPLFDHPLQGGVYIAQPLDNPFGSLLALYVTIDDSSSGTIVTLAGELDADPRTGQLTAALRQIPQLPFEALKLHFFGGQLGLLRTPSVCGSYATTANLTPRSAPESGPPATPTASFKITQSANGAPCPKAVVEEINKPAFSAGTVTPTAGLYSPFVLHLKREDGSQEFERLNLTLPQGLIGKLAGVAECPEADIVQAKAREREGGGVLELASPSCPPSSEVGAVTVGAGAGPAPYYVTGRAYLAGPYKGAPLSLAIIIPAVVGPFDLGDVLVRVALQVDPETAQVSARSDPIPTILHGIPLDLRSISLTLNRPDFTLNPTDCEKFAVTGTATSVLGSTAPLSNPFQVGDCLKLAFRPRLSLRFLGPAHRGAHPSLRTVLSAGKGEAAVARAAVTLPPTELLDNIHIRSICTTTRFAAERCSAGSIYGHAKAWTPLLDRPLEGPVYLRSSHGRLPDLVASLGGQVHLNLVAHVSSVHGRLRNTFVALPDAPLRKLVLTLRGGRRGLLVNSGGLCAGQVRAGASLLGHNGKWRYSEPVVRTDCGEER